MAQPTAYNRQFDFDSFQSSNPTTPLPSNQISAELNAAEITLDGILVNLALIQRDDGNLANNSVGIDQIKSEVTLALNAVSDWATSTAFAINAAVFKDHAVYRCIVAHTSGTFSTDLAANKWSVIVDLSSSVNAAASSASTASGHASTASGHKDTATTKASEASASATASANSASSAAATAATLTGAASTTSLSIATGSKAFTVAAGLSFTVGDFVLCTSNADTTNYMHGQIASYSGTTLTVTVSNIGGSGTKSDWTIRRSGMQGTVGSTGSTGAQGGVGPVGVGLAIALS